MEENENVLCIVEKIQGTTVFVKIVDGPEGTIVTSEIAPGRIRNIRDYVIPGKRIVCKILRIDATGNIQLSLRRVSNKERDEVLEKHEKERSALSILKTILKEKADKTAQEIKKESSSLYEFLQSCKENKKKIEKYMGKEEAEKICQILNEKKEKFVDIKKEFTLSSDLPNGMKLTKEILLPYKDNITYIAAGKFIIKIKSEDYKKANQEMQKIVQNIEEKAKKEKMRFEAK